MTVNDLLNKLIRLPADMEVVVTLNVNTQIGDYTWDTEQQRVPVKGVLTFDEKLEIVADNG